MLILSEKCPWHGRDILPITDPTIKQILELFVEFVNKRYSLQEDIYLISLIEIEPHERKELFGSCMINFCAGLCGRNDGVPYIIVVRGDQTGRGMIDTLAHELAHYLTEWCRFTYYGNIDPHKYTHFKLAHRRIGKEALKYVVEHYVA
jgi:hypothetical protein